MSKQESIFDDDPPPLSYAQTVSQNHFHNEGDAKNKDGDHPFRTIIRLCGGETKESGDGWLHVFEDGSSIMETDQGWSVQEGTIFD